ISRTLADKPDGRQTGMARLLQRMVSDATARMAQAVPGLQRADSQPETNCGSGVSESRCDLLLRQVKREVALLMEVASAGTGGVSKDSPVVHTLCSRVESCLLYGLKRYPGFESMLLLQRVAADCPQAAGLRLDGGSGCCAWIRRALLSGCLASIVEHLAANCRRLYEPESIVGDACYGPLLASLLGSLS
uniref:RUN domain-containing protein n=1 Tax=Macrostomum lignano TaxID=282301 RepID=A0A1I8I038_9PLAT